MTTLPNTIVVDFQPYGCEVLTNLSWAIETHRDYNNGGTRQMKVLRGTVLSGTERSYLAGHVSSRNTAGQNRTVYGVTDAEVAKGHIVRIAS